MAQYGEQRQGMKLNHYKILGVAANASAAEIKRAYRKLAREYHPDVNGTTQDETIKRVNEAYEILSDSRKRQAYDRVLHEARQAARAEYERQLREANEAEQQAREPEMTWVEGVFGFWRELKK